jgi:hypothetical protein
MSLKNNYLRNTKQYRILFYKKTERFLKQKKVCTPISQGYFFFVESYGDKIFPMLTLSRKFSDLEILLEIREIIDFLQSPKKQLLFFFKPFLGVITAHHKMLQIKFSYKALFRFCMLLIKFKVVFLKLQDYEQEELN